MLEEFNYLQKRIKLVPEFPEPTLNDSFVDF